MDFGETGVRLKAKMRSALVRLATAAACGALYLLVLEAFLAIPELNTNVQVRPASGLSPILGLFCGMPAAAGCAVANLISDIMAGDGSAKELAQWFAIQLVYNSVPYLAWYALFRKSDDPFPRLDSALKLAIFLVLAVGDSLLVTALLAPSTSDFDGALYYSTTTLYAFNDIIFIIYLGIPALVLLDISPLRPLAPLWVKQRYEQPRYLNLTQRITLALTLDGIALLCIYAAESNMSILASISEYEELGYSDAAALIITNTYGTIIPLTAAIFIPMLAFLRYMELHFTRPIERLTTASTTFVDRLKHQSKDTTLKARQLSEEGLTVKSEIRDLYDSTYEMTSELVTYIDTLAKVTAERERVAAELDIARTIQTGAVPHDFSELARRNHLDVDATMMPAREVGGDFYDAIALGEGVAAFFIADVSGKGMAAALFMMRAQSLMRQTLMLVRDPGRALEICNRHLCQSNDASLFVTAFVCLLDTRTGALSYANAGHNPISLRRAGGREYLRCAPGLVLGMIDTVSYKTETLDLCPGDSLLLYTDGVTEAQNLTGELYGKGRLEAVLRECDRRIALGAPGEAAGEGPGVPSAAAINEVSESVAVFAGTAPQADDITMLAVRWNLPVERLVVPPEVERLDELNAFLRRLCEREGTTKKMVSQLMLACEELFVNVCNYGFPDGRAAQDVVFEGSADDSDKTLHLTMIDHGVAYDPLAYHTKLIEPGVEHRIGGLGIYLARKYMDAISYERIGDRNILRMSKRYV